MTRLNSTVAPLGTTTALADGVYAFTQPDGGWCLNNSGFICGPDRTIIIDTAATEARTRALLRAADRVSVSPDRMLINTHFHGDHTLGNCFLPADAPILAHPAARTQMREAGLDLTRIWPHVDWGEIEVRLPDVDVADSTTLHTGQRLNAPRVEVHHFGVSHTDNDLIAWLPEERILFAGDQIMADSTPFLMFGSALASREALLKLGSLNPRTVVPGHGPIGGPELIAYTQTYLDWLIDTAKAGLRAGVSPFTLAASSGPGPLPDWSEPERLVANLHRAYADLQGATPAEPLDFAAVFTDLAALSPPGGPVCRA